MFREISIGSTKLRNPVCVAASPHVASDDLSGIGAIFTKTITMNPREGNSGEIAQDIGLSSMINRVGLANEGLRSFVRKGIYELKKNGVPVFVSIHADSLEEVKEMTAILSFECGEHIAGIELNLSCPNIYQYTLDNYIAKLYVKEAVEGADGVPILVKLPPWPDHIVSIARGAIDYGACALTATNTIKALTVDRGNWMAKPFLGGLSGEHLKPISLRCVYELAQTFKVPIIGVGGIETYDDVLDYIKVGASAVQIGTAEMKKPGTAKAIARIHDSYRERNP